MNCDIMMYLLVLEINRMFQIILFILMAYNDDVYFFTTVFYKIMHTIYCNMLHISDVRLYSLMMNMVNGRDSYNHTCQ